MSEMKLESLISEKNLAKALEVSRQSLVKLRQRGCPYLKLAGRAFYNEGEFMAWILKNAKVVIDPSQVITPKAKVSPKIIEGSSQI